MPGRTLADCKAVAATFDNTCENATAVTLSSHAGTAVTCTGTNVRCPGGSGTSDYTAASPCTWNRKLCVTCSEAAGVVKIKVQSNGLPNHCVNSTVNNATAMEHEWEAVWNADVSNIQNYSTTDFDSSVKTDELLCDIQRTAATNMNAASGYNLISRRRELQRDRGGDGAGGEDRTGDRSGGGAEALGTAAGIGLTGMYIFNSLAGGNTDAVENEVDTLDVCLGHPTPSNEIHYHFWSACLKKNKGFWNDSVAPDLCRDKSGCTTDPVTMSKTGTSGSNTAAYTAADWDTVIGVARDGHMIIGPFKSDGNAWGCADRDVCNGAFIDGHYVYVGSSTFPYVVGCWGPGPSPVYQPGCTKSGCGSVATTESAFDAVVASTSLLFATAMVALL